MKRHSNRRLRADEMVKLTMAASANKDALNARKFRNYTALSKALHTLSGINPSSRVTKEIANTIGISVDFSRVENLTIRNRRLEILFRAVEGLYEELGIESPEEFKNVIGQYEKRSEQHED